MRSDSERESLIAFPSSCMRCFNGSSTECSLIVDAPPLAGVPRLGLASTRFDCSGGDPGSQAEPTVFIGNLPAVKHWQIPVSEAFVTMKWCGNVEQSATASLR